MREAYLLQKDYMMPYFYILIKMILKLSQFAYKFILAEILVLWDKSFCRKRMCRNAFPSYPMGLHLCLS